MGEAGVQPSPLGAARAVSRQEVRNAAQVARLRARQTRKAVQQTRTRLRLDSLPLRTLAVRRLLHERGPDRSLWTDLALQARDSDVSEG